MAKPLHIAIAGPIATADVTHLLDVRGPWPAGYGGAPLMATLLDELLRRGHRVSAFTLSPDMPLRPFAKDGARLTAYGPGFSLTWCPMRPRAWPMNPTAQMLWLPGRIVDIYRFERHQLRAAIRAARPDLVHAHWAYEFAAAALSSGAPHLITCHDVPSGSIGDLPRLRHRAYRWLRSRLARRVMARAHALSAPSPWLAGELAADARVPIVVVPNPLPEDLFAADARASRQRAAQAGRRRVLAVCHGFSRRKNMHLGLRAFARLAQRMPEAELVLLGDQMGPGEEAEQWWRAQGLAGRVRFGGAVSHEVVRHWMAQSDVLLHPALIESFGMAVAEALAVGLPVVAGRTSGAIPWLVGEGGTLVDVQSDADMARGLAEVLADRDAAWRRAAMARESLRERCAAPVVAQAFERMYRELLRGGGVGASEA